MGGEIPPADAEGGVEGDVPLDDPGAPSRWGRVKAKAKKHKWLIFWLVLLFLFLVWAGLMMANRWYAGDGDLVHFGSGVTAGSGWEFNPCDWFNDEWDGFCGKPADDGTMVTLANGDTQSAASRAYMDRYMYMNDRDGFVIDGPVVDGETTRIRDPNGGTACGFCM